MPFDEAMELLDIAMEVSTEEKVFERWINGVQMVMEYEEFKKQVYQKSNHVRDVSKKELTEEETYAKVSEILRKER